VRTWTTLAYLLLMLPLGIVYFVIAVTGLAVSAAFIGTPLALLAQYFGWAPGDFRAIDIHYDNGSVYAFDHPWISGPLLLVVGVLLLTLLMHVARALVRGHARLAKSLLVVPGA